MARKASQLLRHLQRKHERRIGRVEADRAHAIFAERCRVVTPGGSVERRDNVVRQAKNLGRLTDRRARAIGDDGGGEPGALAPVALIDVLDHLLAPLVLEIDVDVGRLLALGGNEPLKQ